MVDYPINDRDNQGTLVRGSQGRRGRTGRRRRQIVLPMERLEDRTLLTFTAIAQPIDTLPSGAVYTAGTTNLSAEIPADGDTVTSLSDGIESVGFSYALTAATVPPTWATWGSPPATESATPRVLGTSGSQSSLTMTLSKQADVFGFEMEPSIFASFTLTADFYEGATLVGTISQSVNGDAGALLFAGAINNQGFTSVVVTQESGTGGMAIAQPSYNLGADLSLTKTVSQPQAIDAQQAIYTLNLSNASDAGDALGTTVTDPLPAGTTFQGVGALPPGWTETDPGIGNGGTVTFTDSNPFAAGDSATLTITAQVDSTVQVGTTVTDTATATSDDSNSPSSSASFTVVSPIINLAGNNFLIERDSANPNWIDITTDGSFYQQWANTIQQINLTGLSGNDTLTVDSINGVVNNFTSPLSPNTPVAPIAISFDGSTNGSNELILQQTSGPNNPTLVSDTLDVGAGPAPSQGESSVTDTTGNTQTVFFYNLSPIFDSLPSPVYTITPSVGASLLNASNAINYTEGEDATLTPNPAWGQVTVDSFEPMNFTNKDSLVIFSGPGIDQTNIDNPNVPTGDTGLFMTAITVNGGSSASNPTGSSPGDTLSFYGTGGADAIDYSTTGPGAGTVTDTPPTGPALPIVSFAGISDLAINGQEGDVALTLTTIAGFDQDTLTPGTAIDSGHIDITSTAPPVSDTPLDFSNLGDTGSLTIADSADTLIYEGTTASSTFIVSSSTSSVTLENTGSGVSQIPVFFLAGTSLVLNGKSGSDTAILAGDGSSAAVVTLGGATTIVTGGGLTSVVLGGVGTIDLSNGAGAIDVTGTVGLTNDLAVTPTSSTGASIQDNGTGPWVDLTTGTLTVDPLTGGTLTVTGSGGDAIVAKGGAAAPTVTVGSLLAIALNPTDVKTLSGLVVNSGPGAVGLTVDSSAGAFPTPVTFNGQGGADFLNLKDTGTGATSDTYTPGPIAGSGISTIVFPSGTQTVSFSGLSPVFDFVPSPTVSVAASAASSTILYTEGDSAPLTPSATWGAVTINNLETLNFINKVSLLIGATAGSDSFIVNNPDVPTDLTGITINASSPNASGTLLFNGTTAADTIVYTPTVPNAGTVTDTPLSSAALPTVTFSGIASLAINGQGGGDSLTVASPIGSQATVTPGSAVDSGTVSLTSGGAAPSALTPLSFSDLGGTGQSAIGAGLSITGATTLIYDGSTSSDTFSVSASSTKITLTNTATGVAQIPVFYLAGTTVVLNGLSGSDTAALTGSGAAISVTLGGPATAITGGGLGTVMVTNIGVIDLAAGGGAVSVTGTAGQPDNIAVTPTGALAAQIQDNGTGPWVKLTGSGTLTVGGNAGDFDTVTVNGTAGDDNIAVTGSATNPTVTVNALLPITVVAADTTSLVIASGTGTDTVTVNSAAGAVTVPVTFQGEPTDSLFLTGGTADSDTYTPGPIAGTGFSTLVFPGSLTETVYFGNIAPVQDTVASTTLTVNGTASSNMINYTAGSAVTLGLVTVDNFEPITFSNKGTLDIDGGGGDDTITVNNVSTPTGLAAINVVGGTGADTLVVNANDNLVKSSDVTGLTVSIPTATPVAIGYTGLSKISIINSTDALTGTPATIPAAQDVPLNNVLVATFGFTDQPPYELSSASSFSAEINWGDGTAATPDITAGTIVELPPIGGVVDFQVYGTHTYTTLPTSPATTFPVSVTIFDMGSSRTFTPTGGSVPVTVTANPGATTSVSPLASTATVAVAPLVPGPSVTFTGTAGVATPATTLIGTFTDTNPAATIADFTTAPGSVVVNWGDGSATQTLTAANLTAIGTPNGVTFEIFASHTYYNEAQYPVTITVTNVGGASTVLASTATIADAPLVVGTNPTVTTTQSAVYPIPEFAAPLFTGLVATFTDVNPVAIPGEFTATINWGDGSPQSSGTITQPGGPDTVFDVTGSHTYADSGSYPLTVYITDVGGYTLTSPVTTPPTPGPTIYNGSALTVHNTATVAAVPIVLTGSVNLSTVSGQSTGTLDVTNDNQPAFSGTSQAFSAVTLTATPTSGGTPITLGTTQAQANGAWNLTSTVALPSNTYVITASAINQFGDASSKVTTTIAPTLEIDTIAPVITDLTFDRFNSTMVVTFQDNLSGMDLASLENSAFYHLSGKQLVYNVHVPSLILPTAITVSPGATPSDPVVVTVVFRHGKVLRGGLYFIEIDSGDTNNGIEDNAENALSGRFYGTFPTGDGRPGGNFIASIETFHEVVKPLVPNGAGYVPPAKAVDPPAGSGTATGHAHLKSSKHAKVSSPSKADKVVHRAKSLVNQSAGDKSTHDKALDSLVHETGDRPRGR
jgi:hypothetical protein